MPAATRGGAPVFLTDEGLLRLPSANGRIPEQWPERCTDRVIRRASRRANRSRRIRSVDPSPRIFSGRKMCLSLRSRRHWGIARLRLRCAICVWAWRKTLRFSPGAAASDCLPGLTTDRISGISSYKSSYTKEKALNISAFSCPGQESNLHALRHTHLKRARLAIPPPGRYRSFPELRCAKVILFFELPTLFCEKNYLLKNLY